MVNRMRQTLSFLPVLAALLAPLARVSAQESADALTPRAIADSTYAVRIALDALTETIRSGQHDPRRVSDPQLAAAIDRLATLRTTEARRPPHADLGVLWDLQIEISSVQPEGRDALRVLAHVFLATARDSSSSPVTLVFRRRGDRWHLATYDGLTARLRAISAVVEGSGRP